MSNSSFKDGIQWAFDATSITAFQKCARYYQLSIIEGWKTDDSSVHLRFGGHYATALEHFHKLRAQGMSYDDATFEVVKEALIHTWDYETTPSGEGDPGYPDAVNIIPGSGHPWTPLHAAKTRPNLIRSIIWYLDHFRDDQTEVIMLANGKPAVELSFNFEVDHGIIFAGHLDRLVSYGDDTYVMDQKTTGGAISKYFFDQFSPSTQMSMYTFAGQAVFNVAVKGVIIDAAQIAVGFTNFGRGFTFRSASQLDEWYKETLEWIARIQEASASQHFPMNPASCGNYGGCEYRHICSLSPEVRPQFLRAGFTQRAGWDPLKTR